MIPFYQQIHRTAMVLSVSVAVADLVAEGLEFRTFNYILNPRTDHPWYFQSATVEDRIWDRDYSTLAIVEAHSYAGSIYNS